MKINRLLEITIILLNKGTVTAKYLAERFGVSTRTIYRDLDELTLSGIPIYTNKGKGGGISLLEDYSLNRTILSKHDKESMLLALKTLQAVEYPDIDDVLHKLGSIFDKIPPNDWVEVDFTRWGTDPNKDQRFHHIKHAILNRHMISFDYVNRHNSKSNRKIAPMKLIFKGYSWYLKGVCLKNNAYRLFKMTRMKNLQCLDETFNRSSYSSLDDQEKHITIPSENIELRLRFQPTILYRLYDEYDDDTLIKNDDGTYDVTVRFPYDEWIYSYILSFGHNVEVIEPEFIRQDVQDRLTEILERYNHSWVDNADNNESS